GPQGAGGVDAPPALLGIGGGGLGGGARLQQLGQGPIGGVGDESGLGLGRQRGRIGDGGGLGRRQLPGPRRLRPRGQGVQAPRRLDGLGRLGDRRAGGAGQVVG